MSDEVHRTRAGAEVSRHLSAAPNAMKLPAAGLDIFVVRDFLKPSECDALIRMIDAGRQPSALLSHTDDPEFRTSESCNLDPRNATIKGVEAKIERLFGIDFSHGETIQGQRYAPGQQFKPHHDFFFTTEDYWPVQEAAGGQRTWTAMMFLNAVEEGGQTYFPNAGVRVTPRRGNLLTWNNLDAGGWPNDASLHQGMPVVRGVKYVITKWFRERRWTL